MFPLRLLPLEWSGCLSRMAVAVWVLTQYRNPSSRSLSSLPVASIPSIFSRVSSSLHPALLGTYCLWLSPSVVNLVSVHSAVRLKHHRAGKTLGGGAIVSPQAADALIGEWFS